MEKASIAETPYGGSIGGGAIGGSCVGMPASLAAASYWRFRFSWLRFRTSSDHSPSAFIWRPIELLHRGWL